MANKKQTTVTSSSKTFKEFMEFIREEHNTVGAKSFDEVLADTIKLKTLLTIYTELKLLDARIIREYTSAVSNI